MMRDNEHSNDVDGGAAAPEPMTLYVNIPFCRSKCSFCDYVHEIPSSDLLAGADHPLRKAYVQALCEEIRVRGQQLSGPQRRPHVMYWGGGTASVLDQRETELVYTALRESFDLSALVESTIECSPDSVDLPKLRFYRELGFDRFSSGVQSFDDARLRSVGRRHDADQARQVVANAKQAGFHDISIDIMCGFPDESPQELEHTMREAIALETSHLSLYPFRPTPGTTMRKMIDSHKKELYLPLQRRALQTGRDMMRDAGFGEYALGYFGEPSEFAILFFEGNHNVVGMGSGAVSYYGGRCRTHYKGRTREYIADPTRYDLDVPVSDDGSVISILRAGLSYFPGIDRRRWRQVTGVELDEVLARRFIAPIAAFLRAQGLIEDDRGIRLPAEQMGDILLSLNFQLLKHGDSRKLRTIRAPRQEQRRASRPGSPPPAPQTATGWSELRIAAPRGQQDAILLGQIAPWLEEHGAAAPQHGAFYLRDRQGPHDRLRVWARTEASPSVAQLARRLADAAPVAPTAVERVEHAALDFAEGTYTGPAAAPLIRGVLAEATPRLLEAIARIDGDTASRNEVALELMVAHMLAADFYDAWPDRYAWAGHDGTWPRMFSVFRSHADGFFVMAKDPGATQAALDRHYEAMGEHLRERIAQLVSRGAPAPSDASPGAWWYRLARRTLLRAEQALDRGELELRWDQGSLGDTHDLSVSRFHQAFQHSEALRRFQRTDRGFQAMRFTMSALYLVLSNLGIRLIDRYFLCHAISRACQDVYGIDPAEHVRSQATRLPATVRASGTW